MLSLSAFYKKILKVITTILMRHNPRYLLSYIFLEYLYYRLQGLLEQDFCWITLPSPTLRRMLSNLEDTQNEYVDYDSCALANLRSLKKSNSWFHIYSMISMKKYKLTIVPVRSITKNTILISETMRHNLQNALCHEHLDKSCFLCKCIFSIKYLSIN